jgi:hypothetical protein
LVGPKEMWGEVDGNSFVGVTRRAVPVLGLRRAQQAALRRLTSPASQMAFRVGLAVQIEIRAARTSLAPTSACSHLISTACGRSFRGRQFSTPFASSHIRPDPKSHSLMARTLGDIPVQNSCPRYFLSGGKWN